VACARRQRALCGGMKADAVLEMTAQCVMPAPVVAQR
jgi:hypothetical protein